MPPIVVQFGNGTVPYILRKILDEAQSRDRARQVARGLFAAKLEILLQRTLRAEEVPSLSTSGDFHVGNAIFVLAITLPVVEVVNQLKQLLRRENDIVWLIVRQHESSHWEKVVCVCLKPKLRHRVVVGEIEANIGLTIMMMAGCQFDRERKLLTELIQTYNDQQPVEGERRLAIVVPDANTQTS
jgi:hypothetical protein